MVRLRIDLKSGCFAQTPIIQANDGGACVMSHKQRFSSHYKDPFQSPRANAKKSFNQVNGETEQSQHNIILEKQMRTRT